MIESRTVRVTPVHPDGAQGSALDLAVRDAGAGPAVVLCHGFPELSEFWRHQFDALLTAGYRVIAPDQRGCGGSEAPAATQAYDLAHLCGDLIGLLDVLAIDQAVFVGHDFGGIVTWPLGVLYPERVRGLVGLNTPYLPRAKSPPIATLRRRFLGIDRLHYQLWFQEPGVADAVLARDARLLFDKLVRGGVRPWWGLLRYVLSGHLDMNPFAHLSSMPVLGHSLLSAGEVDALTERFQTAGFTGGLNGYRNFDRNWHELPAVGSSPIRQPSLMITAAWDPASPPRMARSMRTLVPEMEHVDIPRCGHWTQLDETRVLNSLLLDFLATVWR